MKIFLLWRAPEGEHDPRDVAERLRARFAPLLADEPRVHRRSEGAVHLVWLELTVAGFRAAFHEEAPEAPAGSGDPAGVRWAFAPEYPLNARRLVRAVGGGGDAERPLLALARALERSHAAVARELIPPACLVWGGGGEVHVANDGLGQAQLFEVERPGLWVLTNRVLALPLLGVPLEPVREEWAARMATNWFPEGSTGYRGVSFLAGGTHLRAGADGVRRTRNDPLGEWVHPAPAAEEERLERGRQGMLDALQDAAELCEGPTLGLSGGWDSRAVAACLRHLGVDFSARVRGQADHFDVIVSAELARVAGFPHRIKSGEGIPADTAEGCRASVARALLWQGGYFATKKHKNFLARADGLGGGVVNLMGQHAGVGKADFVKQSRALEQPDRDPEDLLVEALLAAAPGALGAAARGWAEERIRASYRVAAGYELNGLDGLLFFYLHEFTRRWGSATVASQTGLVVTPFLCPEVIRACHGFRAEQLVAKPLHAFVTGTLAPDWSAVPYADQVTEEDFRRGLLPRVDAPAAPVAEDLPRWRQVRHHRKYHYKFYWKDVAAPLLDEAYVAGGFWRELFEPGDRTAGELAKGGSADGILVTHLLEHVLAENGPLERTLA